MSSGAIITIVLGWLTSVIAAYLIGNKTRKNGAIEKWLENAEELRRLRTEQVEALKQSLIRRAEERDAFKDGSWEDKIDILSKKDPPR